MGKLMKDHKLHSADGSSRPDLPTGLRKNYEWLYIQFSLILIENFLIFDFRIIIYQIVSNLFLKCFLLNVLFHWKSKEKVDIVMR